MNDPAFLHQVIEALACVVAVLIYVIVQQARIIRQPCAHCRARDRER